MSYILDALRKADAQRERDPAARGIHAQPVSSSLLARATDGRRGPWSMALAVVAAAALAVLIWQLATPEETEAGLESPAPRAAPSAVAAIEPRMPSFSPPPAPAPVPAPVPAAAVFPAAPPPAIPEAAPPAATQKPGAGLREARRAAAPPAASAAPAATSTASTSTALTASPATPASSQAVASARVPLPNELPPEVQKDLPRLTITGGVYSDNPSQRMLIVNGQVLNEGAEPAPGVLLEQIRAKSAVLKFRGHRYLVAY